MFRVATSSGLESRNLMFWLQLRGADRMLQALLALAVWEHIRVCQARLVMRYTHIQTEQAAYEDYTKTSKDGTKLSHAQRMAFRSTFFLYLGAWQMKVAILRQLLTRLSFTTTLRERNRRVAPPSTTKPKSNLQSLFMAIPVLNRDEADLNVQNAMIFLAEKGVFINNYDNLRAALIPYTNRGLALVGDSAQRLILLNQWYRNGQTSRDFWQKKVFGIVGTNAHQRLMATAHGLDKFIFVVADAPENQQSPNNDPQNELLKHKILADTMEALMGAIQGDDNKDWEINLAHFMRVFELDFDAAYRYRKD